VHLPHGEPLNEGVRRLVRKLFPLAEDDIHALEEGLEVIALDTRVAWLLKESLNDGIQRVDESFLVNFKC